MAMRARYSRQRGYVIARQRTARSTVRTSQRKFKFGPTAAKYLGLAVLAVLAVVMLTQSSKNSTNAYTQNQLRKEIGQEDQDIERLRLEARRAQSIQEIQDTGVKQEMQPMGDVQYVEKGEVAGVSTAAP